MRFHDTSPRLRALQILFSCGLLAFVLLSSGAAEASDVDAAPGAGVSLEPPQCTDPPAGLISWWPFDESSGWIAEDIQGGNDGTLNGPSWMAGYVAGALDFDGVADHVKVPHHSSLNIGTGDFSVDLWLRTTDTGLVSTILDKRASSSGLHYGYHVFLTEGFLSLQLADGGWTNYVSIDMPYTIDMPRMPTTINPALKTPAHGFVADGQWHLVVITVDRDLTDGIRWYVDGIEVGKRRNPTGYSGNLDNGGALYIGQRFNGTAHLDGHMDELEFFKRVLSPAEALDLYAAQFAGKCKPGDPAWTYEAPDGGDQNP